MSRVITRQIIRHLVVSAKNSIGCEDKMSRLFRGAFSGEHGENLSLFAVDQFLASQVLHGSAGRDDDLMQKVQYYPSCCGATDIIWVSGLLSTNYLNFEENVLCQPGRHAHLLNKFK